jgi:hypothetical protein
MQVRSNSSPAEYTKEISIMGDPVRYHREMITSGDSPLSRPVTGFSSAWPTGTNQARRTFSPGRVTSRDLHVGAAERAGAPPLVPARNTDRD